MEYKIDCRTWGRFFSVPCSVVDDYILLSDGDFVKVLLCILCSNSQVVSSEKLARQAGVSVEKAEEAIIHWSGLGVISAETTEGKAVAEAVVPALSGTVKPRQSIEAINPARNSIDAKTRVKYSTSEIAEKIEKSDELKALYNDIQTVFKRTINATEMAAILNLYEYYDYSAASILMIAEYCTSIGRAKMAYIETVAKSWFERGICSYGDVENEIIRQTNIRAFESKVTSAFGIQNKLTKKQREFIQKWESMGFSVEMLSIAYEKCMDSTNKLNFGYINKILENWAGKSILTPQQVEADDRKYGQSQKMKSDGCRDSSFNLTEWENYARNFDPMKNHGGDKK